MSYLDLSCSSSETFGSGTVVVDEIIDSQKGVVQGPERALMSAILFDGVLACLNYAGSHGRLARIKFREAFNWITTRGDDYIFSFDNVCQCLGLEPESFRAGILKSCDIQRERTRKSRRTF
jgi:hypothetical protein